MIKQLYSLPLYKINIIRFSSLLITLLIVFYLGCSPVRAGSYSTVSDRSETIGGGLSGRGFATIDEAALWGWENAKQLRVTQGVQVYGGVVYKYINPNPAPPFLWLYKLLVGILLA